MCIAIINNIMTHIFLHGHACIHNLIDTAVDYKDDPYLTLQHECIVAGTTPVAAWHPFSAFYNISEFDASCTINCECDYTTITDDLNRSIPRLDHWNMVCVDFQAKIQLVMHPWNSLDVPGLWALVQTFHWAVHRSEVGSEIEHPDYIYERWYNTLFSEHYSRREWTSVTHGRKV